MIARIMLICKSLMKDIKKKLKKQFEDETQANLPNSDKMEFYRQFKTDFGFENYLRIVDHRKH